MSPHTFIFVGRSGCGKGTQAGFLAAHLKRLDSGRGIFYLETGAEFRTFIKGTTYTQTLSRRIYEEGGLQPEFLSVLMWSNKLAADFKGQEHLIIDGTPRKFHEAGVLHSIIPFYTRGKPHVVHLKVSREWAIERLLSRGRQDDSRADIEERLKWFESDVAPAIEFYRSSPDYRFIEVNGEQPIPAVWSAIQSQLTLS